jgi:3-oxoacyl-[acyl-carrier protein] reductase
MISSELSLTGAGEFAVYAATKGAINSLTKSLAREYASQGVLVNCVAPGPTRTPMMESSPEFHDPKFREAIPLHRFGEPSEIAGAVAFLASPDGAFFVGQIISPNGGAAI